MNKHLFTKKTHGPLFRISAPRFDFEEAKKEGEQVLMVEENGVQEQKLKATLKKMDIPFKSEKPFVIKNKAQGNNRSVGGNFAQPFEEDKNLQRYINSREPAGQGHHLQTQSMVYSIDRKNENMAGSWIHDQNIKNASKSSRERPARHIKSVEENMNPSGGRISDDQEKIEDSPQPHQINNRFDEDPKDFLERSLQSTKSLINYDVWEYDLTPQQWIEICKKSEGPHARSPIYENKKYHWTPVVVKSYDERRKKYLVKILATGIEKYVGRLSLLYEEEDSEKFKERLDLCKSRQQDAEDEIRFFKYVDDQAMELASTLSEKTKRNILIMTSKRKHSNVDNSIVQGHIKSLMNTVEREYVLLMKKCYVLREMSDPSQQQRFRQLRIRLRKVNKYYPYYGTVEKLNFSFKEISDRFAKLHYSSDKLTVKTVNMVSDRTYELFKNHFSLFNISLNARTLPMLLNNFESLQKDTEFSNRQVLHMQWREDIKNDIQDTLHDKYRFYQTETQKYEESPLKKLLRRFDFMFNTYLRTNVVKLQIENWCIFLRNFTVPEEADPNIWRINDYPLLVLNLSIRERKKQKKANDRHRNTQTPAGGQLFQDWNNEDAIYYEPSYNTVITSLTKPFEWLIETTNSFLILEKDLVPLIDIEKKIAFQISQDIEEIKEGTKKIVEYVTQGFNEPNDILELFKKYQYLLDKTPKDVLKQYFGEDKNINIVSLEKEAVERGLRELNQAKLEIQRLCINEKNCRFFQVRTQACKEGLVSKAVELIKTILDKVTEVCNASVKQIYEKYDDMSQNLKKFPKDENELVTLKNYIQEHEVNLSRLDKQVNYVYQFLLVLEENSHDYGEKNTEDFWDLKNLPAEIKEAVFDGQRIASSQEAKLMDTLESDKDKFAKELLGLVENFDDVKRIKNTEKKQTKDNYLDIQNFKERLDRAQNTVRKFNNSELLFKQPITEYDDLTILIKDFEPYNKLWTTAFEFDMDKQDWQSGPFSKLNYSSMEKKIDTFVRDAMKLLKTFGELQEDDAMKVAKSLKEDIEKIREDLWLVELLTIEALTKKPAFWKEVFRDCDVENNYEPDQITFNYLKEKKMLDKRPEIESVSRRLNEQWKVEKRINDITEKLKDLKLEILPYKDSGTYVLKSLDEIQQLLDDQLNILLMLKTSPYIKNVLKKANDLENKLLLIQDTLEGWIKCQRTWMYLEPIFSSEDIKKKLQNEKYKFDGVDRNWRQTMEQFYKEPYIWQEVETDKLKNEFDSNNRTLDSVQKSLSMYLEEKRKYFPRFFFLSDDQLLEILAQTKDPNMVQKHVNKCFEAINQLDFTPSQEVVGMISPEKEKVSFISKIDVNEGEKQGNVERWLLEIESVMRDTLKHITLQAIEDTETPRPKWVLKYPAQVIIAVNMIRWTSNAENALLMIQNDPESMVSFYEQLVKELNEIVDLVRGELSFLDRSTLGALVVIDVHARDVINEIIEKKTSNVQDFTWKAQMRYYWRQGVNHKQAQGLIVEMINSEIKYGFEYLGNSTRLVITPLTDRCYRTLMGAFSLFYGGAPEGPAGTGKTESVKDLAKAVAMQCVVFNCSDGLNYRAMSKFFKGLASSGAWCCFDEFNRIDLEVLSVIAQQVITIQTAIREKRKQFFFEDDDINLIPTCCINITMNPGYAGRSELPDNLKALFRPCAMMIPDYRLISEIYLYSVGFYKAKHLSRKVVASLRLSSEQLSTQDHYDFGMRALKAILTAAGNLKRIMTDDEDIICLRALIDVNLPKFTVNDIPLFESITSDLFPGAKLPHIDYGKLEDSLKVSCFESGLIPQPSFIFKCIQLYDTVNVRHGLMLVGAPFSGKSKVIEILGSGMTKLKGEGSFVSVSLYKLNPKSISSLQLYGNFDPDTRSWTDGVLPIIMRECVNDSDNPDRKWIIFDGPVDAVWIENMNTVLDDNKKLCLTSGEIIKLSNWMTMMFEVQDLSQASPATVSRCGMVYLETKNLGFEALLKSYIKKKFPEALEKIAETTLSLMKWLVEPTISWAKKFGKLPMELSEMNLTKSFLNLFDYFMDDFRSEEKVKVPKDIEDIMVHYLLFSLVWSFGVAQEEVVRPKFHEYFIDFVSGKNINEKYALLLDSFEIRDKLIKIPDAENIYELCYDKAKTAWVSWTQTVPAFKIPKEIPYHELIIPTIDNIRNNFLLNTFVKKQNHMLFTGPTGTGKTVNVINELNKNFYNDDYTNLCTSFSGQTTANQVQRTIEAKVNTKHKKGVFGPEDRKKFIVIFIDDINMPAKEKFGAQPPIELLRQWMDYGGWYDLDSKELKILKNIIFIAAMGPPSQGRNSISGRFTRHFNVIYVEPFSAQSLVRIFSNILEWYFMNMAKPLSKAITNLGENVVSSTILLYNTIKKENKLLPTPAKSHYIYNLRDISKVFQGITKATDKSYKDENDFIKLWAHECMRVFQDRLINSEDQSFFENMLKDIIKSNFKREWNMIVSLEPLLFASFVPCIYPDGDTSKRPYTDIYCEITDHDLLKKMTGEKMEEYNSMNNSNRMNLVLFMNAIQHIIRIVRIITTPFGHALLVGVGGSGRKSLATLSCSIADYDLIQIDAKNWVEELQKVMKLVGLEQKQAVFLFSDTQILDESNLEDVCNILNNGEVPNLFPPEEKGNILGEIGATMPSATPNMKYAYFVQKCRENLHMVICMSPVGEVFRRRIRTFPSLVNCCTIDWFLPWPDEALFSTASNFLSQLHSIEPDTRESLVRVCVDMQQRVRDLSQRYYQQHRRYYYVTPTSYLDLLATFKRQVIEREEKIIGLIKRYDAGVEKIKTTEEEVAKMKVVLVELRPKLHIKQEENKAMMLNLQKQQKEADQQRELCEEDERKCNVQRDEANALKDDCKQELDKVLPILAEATETLEKITRDDITKIKSYTTPPKVLDLVMQGVCVTLGEDSNVKFKPKEPGSMEKVQDFWEYSKRSILNDKLIKRIKNFKEENIKAIPGAKIQKLKGLIKDPDFEKENIKKASEAACNLSVWIRACVLTYDALLVVEPKREQLALAEEQLRQAEALLQEKKDALQEVLDRLKSLEEDYQRARREQTELEEKVDKVQKQLGRAEKLTTGLSGEKESWKKKSIEYRVESKSIIGDVLLASGTIAYMGAFPVFYREECIDNWRKLLRSLNVVCSDNFSLANILSDPLTIASWCNQQKLPNDSFSIENAVILKNSKRWPLLIDPQNQGLIWIKEMEKGNLKLIKPNQRQEEVTFKLESSIQYGFPLLLENLDETIDPLFEPVLQQKIVKLGGSNKIKMGEKFIDYNTDFRFYMTTKLPNPHYTPEICVKVTLLNFMVTQEGLEDQMLNIVVKIEEPIKEEQRQKNIREFFENKNKKKQTEDTILTLLYEATGEILDNEKLIETLQNSNKESIEIDEKLKKQEADRIHFNQIRDFYKDVAKRSSNLFFAVSDLANIEPVYQFSLEYYIELFEKSVDKAIPGKENRIKNINDKFQLTLFDNIVRSLLEKDKLIFSLMMYNRIMQNEKQIITSQEVRFLMMGGTAINDSEPNPTDWLTEKQWSVLKEISTSDKMPVFAGVHNSFKTDGPKWKELFKANEPFKVAQNPWPAGWGEKLNSFQRLLIIRIIRTDKVIPAIQQLITEDLGRQYIEFPPFNIGQAYEDSNYLKPLIFILSTGADPRGELLNLAQRMSFSNNVITLSLGQGQAEAATNAITKSFKEGKWVLLQNCHLASSFMPQLERIYESIPEESNKDFRMWLTTMPSPDFPSSILQKGIKMTYEPPKGLKNNLLISYSQFDNKSFEDCTKGPQWKKVVFGLCFFHALVLERRKFGPLGWNIPYQFSSADLAISVSQLKKFLNEFDQIPWEALNYMVAEANYGGRVTDAQDRRLIKIILSQFYHPSILEEGCKFSQSGVYYPPAEGNLDSFREYIRSLPLNDMTEVFGLHSNAEISGAIYETNNLCQVFLSILPRTVGGAGKSAEDIIKSKCQEILKKLPEPFDLIVASIKHPLSYNESMNTVLQQELIRFNKLLITVRTSLAQLSKAIDGLVSMSNELDEVFNKMFDNLVPDLWAKAAYPSLKPLGSWINDLIDRLNFMQKWIDEGAPPTFWISGFYFTQSFLTGTMQNYARKYHTPIDTVQYKFQVIPRDSKDFDLKKPPDDGCYVYGLYLDGAKWNDTTQRLDEQLDGILFYDMPHIWLIPYVPAEGEEENKMLYSCPVYKTSTRAGTLTTTGHSSNFVIMASLPIASHHSSDHWVRRGVAMLTQLND